MSFDDREYVLNRQGRNPEIYNPKEFRRDQQTVHDYDRLPEFNYRDGLARWIILLGAVWIAYAAWRIYLITF